MLTPNRLVWICVAIALAALPMALKWVPPNRWWGFRTAATLNDEQLWFSANAVAGWALLAACAVTCITVWLAPAAAWQRPWFGSAALLLPLGIALAVIFGYLAARGH